LNSGLVAALLIASASTRIPPVDQCTSDPSFSRFRTELRQTVAHRDRERLLAVVADDVLVSFGGDQGKRDFIRFWRLDRPKSSLLWAELGTALRLGCAKEGEMREAPSFGAQVGGEFDVFEILIALSGSVLRREPRDQSTQVAKLDWHVLTIRKPWDGGRWVEVTLDERRHGFIRKDQTRSPIDYRAGFEKWRGRWQIRSFVAGD